MAAATAPTGPFTPVGGAPLVCRPEDGDTLDPEAFVDRDGARYLFFKSGRQYSTMWLQRLSADGLATVGNRTEVIRSDRQEEANVVEAPTMVRRASRYVLFYSANTFNSGRYFVNYALAPAVTGPYVKADGALLTTDTIGRAYPNPGHEDVVSGPDGDFLVFHAGISSTERGMFLVGLGWGPGDRPEVRAATPDVSKLA